ncbi:uncharacterized protein UV8b_04376 [Ustilaginoidea virens]|uniref:RNAse P Rpr2/Rpp21 subunit domain-containing protein n=1 Tax=Ustilaginoidea virens TaxID=1159556 RepID=A0A8E5HR56_USTVR|nr:uncharacterized protein UV8b_04376 [Ustilaginoidea virens]QUC20135.1 hypothetical protein UV8b_04376 [Ustilaginoidea virens]
MAKAKGHAGVQNRAIYSRASYLYQAATYLSRRADADALENAASAGQAPADKAHPAAANDGSQRKALGNLSRLAITTMKSVSLKAQIRQSPPLKRTVCKLCDTLLVPGRTCRSTVENASKGARKPWADMLVVECKTCGNRRRYPVDAPRQKRATLRPKAQAQAQASAQQKE